MHVQWVIVSVDMPRRGIAPKSHRADRAKAQTMLHGHGLRPVFFLDADNGGATDACHVFGFGHDLCSSILPASDHGLARTLHHFLDGGIEGRFLNSQKVLKSTIPKLLDPPCKVLWHDNVVLATGLFPCLVLSTALCTFSPLSGLHVLCRPSSCCDYISCLFRLMLGWAA